MNLKLCSHCGSTNISNVTIPHCNECKATAQSVEDWNRRAGEEGLVKALKKCEVILATVVRWNKALGEIIGYVPKTGFEAAENALDELRAILKRYGEE